MDRQGTWEILLLPVGKNAGKGTASVPRQTPNPMATWPARSAAGAEGYFVAVFEAREHPDRVFTAPPRHRLDVGGVPTDAQPSQDGATGIDGVTAADYEKDLEANLESLLNRIKSGSSARRRSREAGEAGSRSKTGGAADPDAAGADLRDLSAVLVRLPARTVGPDALSALRTGMSSASG